MELIQYSNLIKLLPYKEQAFETSKATWNLKKYQGCIPFATFSKKVFVDGKARISRGELFNLCACNNVDAIFSIILWGYPRNMRGNSFENVLRHLNVLDNIMKGNKELSNQEFLFVRNSLKGTGIGLSTFTKLLYFFNFHIDGYRCLILDSRIINVLQQDSFKELSALNKISEVNKDSHYIGYLKLMGEVAKSCNCSVDQLELFLFMFGNNLKQVTNKTSISNE